MPQLEGDGPLTGGSTATLTVTDALPNGSATLLVGVSDINAPFKGGVLVPAPDILLGGLPVNGSGQLVVAFPWPAGLPAGVELFWQVWLADGAGAAGFAATNAVSSLTP